ncbi:hypothetical protein NOGI109294_12750 [Nocardiopsis gilva]
MNLQLSDIPREVVLRIAALVRDMPGPPPHPAVPPAGRRTRRLGPAALVVAAIVGCTGFSTTDLESGPSLMGGHRHRPDAHGPSPGLDWGGGVPGWPHGAEPRSRDGRPTARFPVPAVPTRPPHPVPRPRPDPPPVPPPVPRPRPEPRPASTESASDPAPDLGIRPGAVPQPGEIINGPRIPVVGGGGGRTGRAGHEAEKTHPSRGTSASPPSDGAEEPDSPPSPSASPSAAESTGGRSAAAGAGEGGTSAATKNRGLVRFGYAPADSLLSTASGAVGTAATWCLALLLGATLALRLSIGWPRFSPSYRGRRRSDTRR